MKRRIFFGGVGLSLAVLAVLVCAGALRADPARASGQAASLVIADRIEAREIVIRDKAGLERAQLGVGEDNVVFFNASSGNQNASFMVRVFPDGRGALLFQDSRGVNRVAISIREDGRPVVTLSDEANLILHDSRGRNRVVLGAPEESEPHITLYDKDSKATILRAGAALPD